MHVLIKLTIIMNVEIIFFVLQLLIKQKIYTNIFRIIYGICDLKQLLKS